MELKTGFVLMNENGEYATKEAEKAGFYMIWQSDINQAYIFDNSQNVMYMALLINWPDSIELEVEQKVITRIIEND